MKYSYLKLVSFFVLLTVSFSGCMDEYINPVPKCTDAKVINKLSALLNNSSIYGADAIVNEESIVLVGTNEKTNMKRCKAKIDYSIKNEDNNSLVNMVNNIPFMSEISKNIDVTYTIVNAENKKDFIIEIIE